MLLLYDLKVGAVPEPWGHVDGRLLLDTVPTAFADIAARNPDDYLEVFGDPRWERDSDVLAGFGEIDDPRATRHLIAASLSKRRSDRLMAAVLLHQRVSPETTDALIRLASDADAVIRHKAIDGLHVAGEERAAATLRALPEREQDRELVDAAIRAIDGRTRRGEPAPGRRGELDLTPSEIRLSTFVWNRPDLSQLPLTIEQGTLVLNTEARRIEVMGTPFWTGGFRGGSEPGFRARVPLEITIDGQQPVGEQRTQAIRAVTEAAESQHLRIDWPATVK